VLRLAMACADGELWGPVLVYQRPEHVLVVASVVSRERGGKASDESASKRARARARARGACVVGRVRAHHTTWAYVVLLSARATLLLFTRVIGP
jgi:hypothetical protein